MRTQQDETLLRSFIDASGQLARSPDVEGALACIVERAMEVTGAAYGVGLALQDHEVDLVVHRGLTTEQMAAVAHPGGRRLLRLVLDQPGPVRFRDLPSHSAGAGFPQQQVPVGALIGIPLRRRGRPLGALYLAKPPDALPFSDADEDAVAALAAMAATVVENARLFAAESGRAARSALLHEIAGRIRNSLDVAEVLGATVETLGRAADVDRCFIQLVEDGRLAPVQHHWHKNGTGPGGSSFAIAELAAATRSTEWSEDVLASPLEWGEDLLGVVVFQCLEPRTWTPADVALIQAAAREVSIAVHHAGLYHEAVRTAARLQEVDEARREFVSMVSHELRSPMTVIAGIADILQVRADRLSNDQRTELVDMLGREARRLARLVSETLDLERIDRDGFDLELSAADLTELAYESVADSGSAARTDLVAERGDHVVVCDRDRIKQVFLNLLSNAAKFSHNGTRIRVTITPGPDFVTVAVADRGPGIDPDEHDRLFRRFSRIDSGDEPKPGSGLGLYLSKAIVELHGGSIWVLSTRGEGATFSFRVPRRHGE